MALEQVELNFSGKVLGVLDALLKPFAHEPDLDFFQGKPAPEFSFLCPQLRPPFLFETAVIPGAILPVLEKVGNRQGDGANKNYAQGQTGHESPGGLDSMTYHTSPGCPLATVSRKAPGYPE